MQQPEGKKNIYLIGMMGSGKSYWAHKLGGAFGLASFDLDKLIENKAGKSIREIFEQDGEDAFRQLEASMLREGVPAESYVLACGGGTPCFLENMDFMKSTGVVVWLNPSLDELARRLQKGTETRPILAHAKTPEAIKEKLQQLSEHRLALYQQSDLIIEDDLPRMQQLVSKVDTHISGN